MLYRSLPSVSGGLIHQGFPVTLGQTILVSLSRGHVIHVNFPLAEFTVDVKHVIFFFILHIVF